MPESLDELVDFGEFSAHIESCGKSFRDAVLDYFRLLGERSGHTIRENSSVIKYGLALGRIDLAWVEPNTIFFCEFASLENILRDCWLALEFNPSRVVFLLSGKSKASPNAVEKLLSESGVARKLVGKTVLVDVSGKTIRSL